MTQPLYMRASWFAAIALAAIPIASPASRTDTKPAPSAVQEQRGTEKQPVVVAPVNIQPITVNGDITSHISKEDARASAASEDLKSVNEHSLTLATWVLSGLTLVLAVIAGIQVWMFYRQLDITRTALGDAKTAANAAKESAEALPLIERAYLFIDVGNIRMNYDQNTQQRHLFVSANITNHGKTPAVLTRIRAYIAYQAAVPDALIETPNATRQLPKGLVIGASDEKQQDADRVIVQTEWNSLMAMQDRLYVVGLIDYKDVLDQDRSTGFCWHSYYEHEMLKFMITPGTDLNYYH